MNPTAACLWLGLASALLAACQSGDGSLASLQTDAAATDPATAQPSTQPATSNETPFVRAPQWRVGDSWRYNDGYGLKVETVAAGETRFVRLDDPAQWLVRQGFLRKEARSATTHRKLTFRSIDADQAGRLELDKPVVFTREYAAGSAIRVHATSWVLEGRETITVPAGSFDCHVVVMRTRSMQTDWTGFERWWYSPAVGHYVRMEYRYGDRPLGSRVLVSYARAEMDKDTAEPVPKAGLQISRRQ